jgi:hypothetical protein
MFLVALLVFLDLAFIVLELTTLATPVWVPWVVLASVTCVAIVLVDMLKE